MRSERLADPSDRCVSTGPTALPISRMYHTKRLNVLTVATAGPATYVRREK